MMSEIEKNSIQFDYFSSNYQKFEDDFYNFSTINIPLTFLTDDILKNMISSNHNYFRLNSSNSKDKKDHYFIFNIYSSDDNNSVRKFEYIGHKYKL